MEVFEIHSEKCQNIVFGIFINAFFGWTKVANELQLRTNCSGESEI
jgi:hypothetical protein